MAKVSLHDAALLKQGPDQLSSQLDDETIIMHTPSGGYFTLDEVGTAIWKRLETGTTLAALCEVLAGEFDVDAQTCRRDTLSFLESLAERGLIVVDAQ